MRYSIRVKIALFLLVVIAFIPNLHGFSFYKKAYNNSGDFPNDQVAPFRASYECIKPALPGSGTIGFISSLDGNTLAQGTMDFSKRLVVAQSILSPVILDQSDNHEWVILNLGNRSQIELMNQTNQAILEIDCGNGIALIRKLQP